jgi:hypothetical protein
MILATPQLAITYEKLYICYIYGRVCPACIGHKLSQYGLLNGQIRTLNAMLCGEVDPSLYIKVYGSGRNQVS